MQLPRSLLLLALVPSACAAAVDTTFFEARIRPVLAAECVECHGAEKQKGGLRLDWRGGWQAGGDSGSALSPGDPDGSLILQSMRHAQADLKMPKDGAKLDAAVLRDFADWIRAGAPDPRDQPPALPAAEQTWEAKFGLRKQWWCFLPVTDPAPPAEPDPRWSRTAVDRFLRAAQRAQGLEPAAPADPSAWLRRVTFALTGLPPTLEEQQAFLDDASPGARERVVDRLLASTLFGERWARHWMDLTRYADSHGSEGDPEIPFAWRYRDYLVRAFNADVPLDQLIREHLAGDLLPQPRINAEEGLVESRLGVAHLRLHEHGFQPVDTLDEQVRVVENQIDTVFKSFQALTVSCARCHDHKFDPLSQRDYTALTGILMSSRPAQLAADAPTLLQRNRDALADLKRRLRASLASTWREQADRLSASLAGDPAGEARRARHRATAAALSAERTALMAAARARAGAPVSTAPAPVARWDFEGDARDRVGALHAELQGGARLEDGRLILDGKNAFAQSAALDRPLRERTLEAWVSLDTLDQGGGGVITVETGNGNEFDAIVYAERQTRRWAGGSEFFRRGRDLTAAEDETTPAGELVHVALTFKADGEIALYRNGKPYGTPHTPASGAAGVHTYRPGDGRLLFGRRHTGGGKAYLKGAVEEARLYDHALSPSDIAASHAAGPDTPGGGDWAKALSEGERARLAHLDVQLAAVKALIQSDLSDGSDPSDAAKSPTHPLHPLAHLHDWAAWMERLARSSPAPAGKPLLTPEGSASWFREGTGLALPAVPGDFTPEREGDEAVTALVPPGVFTASLTRRHHGVFSSPRFLIDQDRLRFRAAGGGGATVKLIVDNYPLPQNGTFPKAVLDRAEPGWITFDTEFRKGYHGHLEFATALDTPRVEGKPDPEGRSWFWVGEAWTGDRAATAPEPALRWDELLGAEAPADLPALVARLRAGLRAAVDAWEAGTASAAQVAWLNVALRGRLLSGSTAESPALLAEYRRLENEVPVPRRAPGVLEGTAFDAPFLPRGDHKHPGEPVPRGFLSVLGGGAYATAQSGRLELARDLTRPDNPLTARVMANRVWHHLFGVGLVPTVDNFGRLGEKPSHPELLDHLSTRLARDGWSLKRLLRELVLTEAYALDSRPSPAAAAQDPGNIALTHFRVRRLEAEAIRDSLLALSGRLDPRMGGPGDPPNSGTRRTLYQTIRRNGLPDLPVAFDFAMPTSTRGARETTNVPAQSLALLNDPTVRGWAADWADRSTGGTPEERFTRMIRAAFARAPAPGEWDRARAHLSAVASPDDPAAWRDLAHTLFNAKEFIYLR